MAVAVSSTLGCGAPPPNEEAPGSGSVQFAGSIPQALAGEDVTRVTVTLTATQSIDTTPAFDNTVPCIDSLVASASTVLPGGSITLRSTAHDPDVNDTFAYAWTATGGSFTSNGTATTQWTAPQTSGTYSLTLTVTDSRGASASINVSINVISTDGGTAGSASVGVSFNTSPTVRGITVSRSPVPVGQSTTVTVDAVDGDGDTLSYQWTAACAGTWTQATSPNASFTPSALPTGDPCGNCPLTVAVTDTKGGRSQGTLRICVGPGTGTSVPPRIVLTNQSATSVAGGGSATLRVIDEDGDGSALTFGWAASTGTVGTPANGFTSSEVRWTAPACVASGAAPTITATVTNARGFSASHTFSVSVLNGTDCGSGTVAKWDTTGSLLTPRYGANGVLLSTGKVLVTGGYNQGNMLTSAELYDPATGTWTAAGNLSVGRWLHTLTVLPSGRILAIGGTTTTSAPVESRAVDIYDPTTNSWTAAAPMTFARARHTATLLPSGKVLVVGGSTPEVGTSRIPELYDPATNSWVPVASAAAASRSSHVTVPLPSGKLLVAGGGASAELYDPPTDTWVPATGVSGAGWSLAYLQPSGKVLLNSGLTFALYDPALNTQTNAGTLVHGRSNTTQMLLASGKLLVTGGITGTGALTELYDPATGTTSFSVSMPSARYGFTGILLPSGKVLVAGGVEGSNAYLNTALLYTP